MSKLTDEELTVLPNGLRILTRNCEVWKANEVGYPRGGYYKIAETALPILKTLAHTLLENKQLRKLIDHTASVLADFDAHESDCDFHQLVWNAVGAVIDEDDDWVQKMEILAEIMATYEEGERVDERGKAG